MTEFMDKGAHFYRCDFQVHTPRDARWSGSDAVTAEERIAYANELIQACRQKSLNAVAITDHHDFVMVPYIRNAARAELDAAGAPVTPGRRLIVFPGLELTLTTPTCQAVLLLDADFPDNLFQSVLNILAIQPSPDTEKHHAPIQRIPTSVINGLDGLHQKFNDYDYLRGRFIVLPNVSEGGNSTLLRSGFANYYKTMPCVGGYVDGSLSKLGVGKWDILNGRNQEYGNKSIATYQTSDNRRRDHANLGVASTWVKWAVPSAEALRQACLARDSRISQDAPELPSVGKRSNFHALPTGAAV